MSVLDWETHTNLADHHDWLEKLKDFCQAEGWTIDDFRQSCSWAWDGAQYDWDTGSESFLEITSAGYGSQTLNFRFRARAEGTDPDHEWVVMGAQQGEAINNALSTHPVDQDAWNTYKQTSFNPSTIPQSWFFGNDTFVLSVIKFDASYCGFVSFGSVELYDASDTEGNWAGYSQNSSNKWYDKHDQIPFDFRGDNLLYDGSVRSSSRYGCDLRFTTTNLFQGEFLAGYGRSMVKNAYSEVRPMAKPRVFIKHVSDDLWRPLGTFPIFRVDVYDLKIGERLVYGTEEYLVFPNCKGNNAQYKGLAVRIT